MRFPFGAVETPSNYLSLATKHFSRLLNITGPGTNICYSPFGVQVALTILHQLASGETRSALEHAFDYGGEEPAENIRDVHRRRRAYNDIPGVHIVSSLWLREPSWLVEAIETKLRTEFGSESFVRDFDAHGVVAEINEWARNNTNGRITHIVDDVSLMQLLVANAIHFNCNWESKFSEHLTKPEWFTFDDGSKAELPRMKADREFQYYEDKECQAVSLSYEGKRFAMQVILPAKGVFLPGILTGAKTPHWANAFSDRPGFLEWPLFQFKCEPSLSLKMLGLPGSASLDPTVVRNASSESVPVDLKQRTWIRVDESGTEAAAVTYAIEYMSASGWSRPKPPKPFEMIVDRPFYFVISDMFTEVILFIGRVANPRGH